MAYRRRRVRVKRRYRRILSYRARRPRLRRRRRVRSGNLVLNCRVSRELIVPHKSGAQQAVSVSLNSYPELAGLYNSFEAYRIHNIRVKVIPQVTSTTSSTPIGPYHIAPWHREEPTVNANTILSIDGCRTYKGTHCASRNFVTCVLSNIGFTGVTNSAFAKANWRPRIELSGAGHSIPHYGGIIYWDPVADSTAAKGMSYTVIMESRVTLYNQKGFVG